MKVDEDDTLDRIDLHAWRVPPPAALDRASIVTRVLSPSAAPRRSRGMWVFAALAIANVVLAAIIIIVISQRSASTTVTVRPAGGGTVDAQTAQLLRHLEQEQRDLESKLAEVEQLRAEVEQLAQRVHDCEQTVKREPPGTRPRVDVPAPADDSSCDEVWCVLNNYASTCCAKFKTPPTRAARPSTLPDGIDRNAIAAAMTGIQPQVQACGPRFAANGIVKVHVRVSPAGRVDSVSVERTPDAALGECVVAAIRKATFDPTLQGGSFSYPFVFGATP